MFSLLPELFLLDGRHQVLVACDLALLEMEQPHGPAVALMVFKPKA
jgi:hypothetical protein